MFAHDSINIFGHSLGSAVEKDSRHPLRNATPKGYFKFENDAIVVLLLYSSFQEMEGQYLIFLRNVNLLGILNGTKGASI
jgi:hypothetical protein